MASNEANLGSFNVWIAQHGWIDESMYVQYIASLYWATVTITTVGYGDILPVNGWEVIWAMFIIVFGVAVFAQIQSNLSTQVTEISRTNESDAERVTQIIELDQKFFIGQELVEKLTNYVTGHDQDLEVETNQEMSYLLKILPSTLKTKLAKFMYYDVINVFKFLQDREDDFYSKFLEELEHKKFTRSDIISVVGKQPEYVYFIMNGVVQNVTTGRYFEAGQMINHDCIFLETLITQDYVAETDVQVLAYEKETFISIYT